MAAVDVAEHCRQILPIDAEQQPVLLAILLWMIYQVLQATPLEAFLLINHRSANRQKHVENL